MTTPVASGTLYASVADLRDWVGSTDAGIGTPAQLSDEQLQLCLYSASNRVSVYVGGQFDSSSPEFTPPPVYHDLTLDLAAFFAWRTYLKGKVMPADQPVYEAYQNAMQILDHVRQGSLSLDMGAPGSTIGSGTDMPKVINRVPAVFTGRDSNTRVVNGQLEDDVPAGLWAPRGMDMPGGPIYQG